MIEFSGTCLPNNFSVIGFYAAYCRFSPGFIERLEDISGFYDKIQFLTADIETHSKLAVEERIKGTPALLIICEPYLKDAYTGNFNTLQISALINLSLSKLEKTLNGQLTNAIPS